MTVLPEEQPAEEGHDTADWSDRLAIFWLPNGGYTTGDAQ
jgi:hypothetical protein